MDAQQRVAQAQMSSNCFVMIIVILVSGIIPVVLVLVALAAAGVFVAAVAVAVLQPQDTPNWRWDSHPSWHFPNLGSARCDSDQDACASQNLLYGHGCT